MKYLNKFIRLRRLRSKKSVRNLFQETEVTLKDLILPIFVEEDIDFMKPISSMPGVFRIPEKLLAYELEKYAKSGINSIITFGISHNLDENGSDTWNNNGLISRILRICKNTVPEIIIISDMCFCEYTIHGHCGIINNKKVDNDQTLLNLERQSIIAASSGADFVAPSSSMDGQVKAIRSALDKSGLCDTGIMSYSTKFHSELYNPFRDATYSNLKGDRKTYQVNPMNRKEAIRESLIDVKEGSDVLIIKPAINFLDIIRDIKNKTYLPLIGYQVSGEYSMIKLSSKAGIFNERNMIMESIGSIKRAGASAIITYFAMDIANNIL
ncbi:hemB [Wigglesworthia glossinidia endosymbiont of Glossina brevipalpis]|uniref:Delta-aminolevulinic acid dehydratase n=1 Tax=Wigglesworthia glossinidia brevipalpis TaxID=36870 RepID=Q8D369_WIGBR|nr:hemB [Wigglesworthia glossinidia endosymbiont of Glossina brevipalpis]